MRVAQRSMYNSFVSNMNRTLANYMESNIQSSSQKKVNRPSDDPVGMVRVLNYRSAIARNEQYESNTNDAAAWLRSTDSALTQAQVILSSLQEKAEELATGTLTSENRKQASHEIRQLFEQLVNIANTQYGDEHLFAGHKTGTTPYQIGLAVTATNATIDPADPNKDKAPVWEVSGSSDTTVMVRFPTGGELGTDEVEYEYSTDGGETWVTKTLPAGGTELDLDGVTVKVPQEPRVTVEAYDPDKPTARDNGSMLFIREAAYYNGDDNDPEPKVDSYGSSVITSTSAKGNFDKDVRIRLDEDAFANTDGGRLLIGVKDNGRIAGVRSEEEKYMIEAAAQLYCIPEVEYTLQTFIVEGKQVLVATIEESPHKPVYAKDENGKPLAYLRIKDENILATPIHLRVWQQSDSPRGELIRYTEREQLLLDLLEQGTLLSLNRYCRQTGLSRRAAEHLLAKFVRYEIVEPVFENHKFYFRIKSE